MLAHFDFVLKNEFHVCLFVFFQVPFRHKGIYPQWDERNMGAGESRATNETQRARDMGTIAQSRGQQGLHLGEAYRSVLCIHILFPNVMSLIFQLKHFFC